MGLGHSRGRHRSHDRHGPQAPSPTDESNECRVAYYRSLCAPRRLEAIKADTFALTAFEFGLFAWMALIYFFLVPRPEMSSPIYWFMMQIGMILGFIVSYPPNWYLVRSGVKPSM